LDKIAQIWNRVNGFLFPHLKESLPAMTEGHLHLATVLEVIRIEDHVPPTWVHWYGRKPSDRKSLARAFVAKVVYKMPTNKALAERLRADKNLRMLCGWEYPRQVPSESTFSRAFEEYAKTSLLDRVHEALVKYYLCDEVVWHVSRDSTAIEAREKPVRKPVQAGAQERPKGKRGRPKKGEETQPAEEKRLARQRRQTAEEALSELPTLCDIGTKTDAKGHKMSWCGYKLNLDVVDGDIPVLAVTTSASLHDSQPAIPMMKRTAERVTSWYDLMDKAYDAKEIREVSIELGHVPIIDANRRRGEVPRMEPDRAMRYRNRSSAERVNARLKDDCGGSNVRVRGAPKVHTHLMFGVLVIFAEALLALA
jgi:hypothetical protein